MARPAAQQDTLLHEVMREAEEVAWSRGGDAHAHGTALLDRVLAEPGLLRAAVLGVAEGRVPGDGCESFEGLDKLVLWQSADRELRLRLHLFPAGYAGRPHHHRWSFVSRVVSGAYLHTLYGSAGRVLDDVSDATAPVVINRQRVVAGSDYFLDHSVVHVISTDQTAVSLMLRGPSVRSTYFTVLGADGDRGADGAAGGGGESGLRVRWNRGAAEEDATLRRAKAMAPEDFVRVVGALEDRGVI